MGLTFKSWPVSPCEACWPLRCSPALTWLMSCMQKTTGLCSIKHTHNSDSTWYGNNSPQHLHTKTLKPCSLPAACLPPLPDYEASSASKPILSPSENQYQLSGHMMAIVSNLLSQMKIYRYKHHCHSTHNLNICCLSSLTSLNNIIKILMEHWSISHLSIAGSN